MSTYTETLQDIHGGHDIELQPLDNSECNGNFTGPKTTDCGLRDKQDPPPHAVPAMQRWSDNKVRIFASFYSFAILGLNDGVYGALIPYFEQYYGLTYTVVSLIFLSPFIGYSLASILNHSIHVRFGQRGVAIIGPVCHIITYVVLAVHPPYPVLVIVLIFAGFGNGLIDAAWCAWIGAMMNGNQVSGFLQASYSLGATVSPLIATTLISSAGWKWFEFFYLMVGAVVVELVFCGYAYRKQTGECFLAENPPDPNSARGPLRAALSNRITWLFAIFVLGYVGAEVAIGGWIVTFMLNVRAASNIASGAIATGFWGGMTLGRMVLGFVTERFGERFCVFFYLGAIISLELIFWLVPSFLVSAIAVAFLGFFMGPLFPCVCVVCTKLLPKHLHVGSIGFATAFGGSGGAIFPFAVGAIAQAKGVQVLQPIILALFAAITLVWLCLPRVGKKDL